MTDAMNDIKHEIYLLKNDGIIDRTAECRIKEIINRYKHKISPS